MSDPTPLTGPAENDRTRATVVKLLGRLGDPSRIAEMFAEPVDWRLDWPAEGHPAVPWIRPRSTCADVADHFRALDDADVAGKGSFRHPGTDGPLVLVDGRYAVVLGVIEQTVKATGAPYAAMCALHLTVDDGLVTSYHVYEDSLTVARTFAAANTPGAARSDSDS